MPRITGRTQRPTYTCGDVEQRTGQGRPRGKRRDPNFEQITAYIRKRTHQGVKIALLQEGRGQGFSELVEELIAKWLKARS